MEPSEAVWGWTMRARRARLRRSGARSSAVGMRALRRGERRAATVREVSSSATSSALRSHPGVSLSPLGRRDLRRGLGDSSIRRRLDGEHDEAGPGERDRHHELGRDDPRVARGGRSARTPRGRRRLRARAGASAGRARAAAARRVERQLAAEITTPLGKRPRPRPGSGRPARRPSGRSGRNDDRRREGPSRSREGRRAERPSAAVGAWDLARPDTDRSVRFHQESG